jgi:hypothetical protein
MRELKDMIGEVIVAYIPLFHETEWQQVKLLGVEPSGLWIENQKLMSDFLTHVGVKMSPKTMIFFLPFTQVTFIAGSLDAPTISERAIL